MLIGQFFSAWDRPQVLGTHSEYSSLLQASLVPFGGGKEVKLMGISSNSDVLTNERGD
jgi:hypothetical protein